MTYKKKKILKMMNEIELKKTLKEHISNGWEQLSDVKVFFGENRPFQVLVGLREFNE